MLTRQSRTSFFRILIAAATFAACSSEPLRHDARTTGDSTGSLVGSGAGGNFGSGSTGAGGSIVIVPPEAGAKDATTQIADSSGVINDARPEVSTMCVPEAGSYVPGPYPRKCAAPTD